jgi:hydrogenase-4 component B
MTAGHLLWVAAIGVVTGVLSGRFSPRLWLASTVTGVAAALVASIWVLSGGPEWEWHSAFRIGGEPFHLRLDSISSLFLSLLCVVGGAGAVYSSEYWPDRAHPRSARAGRVWWSVLIMSVGAVLLSSNGLHFLIAWELLTVSSFFLITLDRRKSEVRAAGWLYLGASHAATLSLFAYFAAIAASTGAWDLGPMHGRPELAPLFWLALFGFGVKAGIFPLHIWLPSAHANAPSHVSAIMSGVTIKVGIYGLVRFTGWMPVPEGAGWVVAVLGVVSAVLGVAFALGQHDLKRLLAYHSVENIGIILIGLGFALVAVEHGNAAWGLLALAGGLLHVWNHGLFKSLLFLGAGSVLHSTRTREMSRLGGLWRAMPWTTALFALGAAAISGLPPLNGFVSEWLIFLGLFDAVNMSGDVALASVPALVLLGMTGALALACFIKVCGVVFLGQARSAAAENARECGIAMRGPMILLAAGCVAIGLLPAVFFLAVARAAAEWNPAWSFLARPAPIATLGYANLALVVVGAFAVLLLWRRATANGLLRGPTWNCGYAAPTARMQYTSGSFAGIINEWFAWIIRPTRHERKVETPFPVRASFEEHSPETVLEHVVIPAGGVVIRISDIVRKLQHGRLQAYLLYIVLGLAALGALVLYAGAH